MKQSVPMPTPILLIAREPLVAGRENAYRKIEEQTARLSAELGCPHLVIEWRVTNTSKGKVNGSPPGQVIPYAGQRAYTDRLNALFIPRAAEVRPGMES